MRAVESTLGPRPSPPATTYPDEGEGGGRGYSLALAVFFWSGWFFAAMFARLVAVCCMYLPGTL